MNDRLKWLLEQLDKLNNDGHIRYEGNSVFQGARAELDSVIAGYDDVIAAAQAAAPPPPAIVNQVMTAEQVAGVIASMQDKLGPILTAEQVSIIVHSALEESDVAVMAAITETGGDVIAALTPATEPAAAPQ